MVESVTLRKAAKIRSKMSVKMTEIQQEFRGFATTQISIYTPTSEVGSEFDTNETKALAIFARLQALGAAYADVRKAISAANESNGISELLASANYFEAMLNVVRQQKAMSQPRAVRRRALYGEEMTPTDAARPSQEVILARIAGQVERSKVAAAVQDEMMVFPTYQQKTLNDFERFGKEVENKIAAIHDKMEQINNSATITLSDNVLAVLRTENIYPN